MLRGYPTSSHFLDDVPLPSSLPPYFARARDSGQQLYPKCADAGVIARSTSELDDFAAAIASHVFCYLPAAPHLMTVWFRADRSVRDPIDATFCTYANGRMLRNVLLQRESHG